MTFYRPGAKGPSYSKHSRVDRHNDRIFSNDPGAVTDWLPVNAGDSVSLYAQLAQLRQAYDNTLIAIDGEFDVVLMPEAPVGGIQLEYKLGGEADAMAMIIGGPWQNTGVIYSEPVQTPGFVRVKFTCQGDKYDNEFTNVLGQTEVTPIGMLIRLMVTK